MKQADRIHPTALLEQAYRYFQGCKLPADIAYRPSSIAERVQIGAGAVIGQCRVFGQIVHGQTDTTQPWDEHEDPEPSAVIEDYSFVGFGAIVVGGIRIGPRSYVCAGAVVTRDVPPEHVDGQAGV